MQKQVKWLMAAAMAVAFVGTMSAQEPRRGGNQPPGGRGGFQGGMGFGGGFGNVYGMLSTNKDLQTELKITDEQKKKLEDVAKEQRTKMQDAMKDINFREMTDEQRKELAEKTAKLAAESKKAYEGVLTADQAKRTTQINYQYMGVRAFSDKDVQTALKATDEQKDKIKTIMETYQKDSRELGGGRGAGGGGGAGSDENRKKREALTKDTEEKIVAVLNDDQKKSWKDMIGEKFDVSKLRVAPPRPRDN